jgi:hypothetical protein
MGNITETSHFEELLTEQENEFATEYLDVTNENVERVLYSYRSLERQVDELNERKNASIEFYNGEIEKIEKNMNYKSNVLRSFVEGNNKKTMKFPNATMSIRKSTKHVHSGSEKKLIEWCEKTDKDDEFGLVKETKKPSKSAIIKFIKDTGFSPDDWDIIEKSSFTIKTQ